MYLHTAEVLAPMPKTDWWRTSNCFCQALQTKRLVAAHWIIYMFVYNVPIIYSNSLRRIWLIYKYCFQYEYIIFWDIIQSHALRHCFQLPVLIIPRSYYILAFNLSFILNKSATYWKTCSSMWPALSPSYLGRLQSPDQYRRKLAYPRSPLRSTSAPQNKNIESYWSTGRPVPVLHYMLPPR